MDETESTFDPATRRLCPDGACVGVLGEDGCCKVCGRRAEGEAPGQSRDLLDDRSGDDDDASPATATGEAPAFDPATRRLCPDGACVGVLGPDGVCPVCGRKGE